ncbi:MAG: curli-like amyloid fiber formation chaperone CsgH [Pseudomonadota bacterium]
MSLQQSFFRGSWIAVLAGLLWTSAAAEQSTRLLAWIDVDVAGDTVTFKPVAAASDPIPVRYALKVMRIGKGGSSTSQQGGTATLPGGDQSEVLSTTTITLSGVGALSVELTVTGPDGKEVSALISSPRQSAL